LKYRIIIVSVIFCMIAVSVPVSAQQTSIGTLLGLSVEGVVTSEPVVVKMSSGLKEGSVVTWEDIQHAVKQLWALGVFSDIRIVLDKQTAKGIFLTIKVEEYPRLERLVIEGNKKLKKADIEKEVGFFRGQVLNATQISEAKQRLLEKYYEKGYTLASIETSTFKAEKEGRAVLQIKIKEGEKVQIRRIRFFGNTVFTDGKLKKQMKKTKEDTWWRGADFKRDKYEEDKEKVVDFYRNNGYRDAEIVKDSLYYDKTKKDMFIDLWVREGKCYYIGNISWEGNTIFKDEELTPLLKFKSGDVFSEKAFQESISEKVGGAYYDKGYIFAQINPKETLRSGDTLDIHFVINEGEPVKIRQILISGNNRTKDRVIRRELRIRPGDVFSKELLMRSQRDLMVLNYFSNVVPNVLPVNDKEMDLSFKVEEKSTDTANLSAGWSELDRLIGSVGLGMNNLFGNGQILSLNWNFGQYYRSFNLGFTEPWFMNTPTLIGLSIYDTKRDPYYIGYSQKTRGFSLRLGRRFSWPDNYFRGDWIYRIDETELGDFSDYYIKLNPNNIVNEDWPLTTSGVTQIISRNSLNHPEFPTMGSRVSLSTEVTGGIFGGNVGYHKHIFKAEFFYPTFIPKLILLTRVQVGAMGEIGNSKGIPYLDYFFIGGSGMSRSIPLRGYDDPLAGGGIRAGGKTMFETTIELRFPMLTNPMMFGLLFAEAGNTWFDLSHTDPFNLRRSVGIGARIFMPMVGMLGFDYAYGFDQIDQYGRKYGQWRPQFVFGRGF